MIVKNPTDKEISVQILGTQYTVPAKGERAGVDKAHAIHWKTQIHHFISIVEEDELATAQESEEVSIAHVDPEVMEEIQEDAAPEEVEEETVNLDGLKRSELDELAEAQGLDSTEYKTVKDIRAALEEVIKE